MRNKHPIQLAGITLFTRQSTTQDTCAPEKEEKSDPPKGVQFPITRNTTGYMVSSVSANKKLFFFYVESQNQKVSLKNKVINMINYNTVII